MPAMPRLLDPYGWVSMVFCQHTTSTVLAWKATWLVQGPRVGRSYSEMANHPTPPKCPAIRVHSIDCHLLTAIPSYPSFPRYLRWIEVKRRITSYWEWLAEGLQADSAERLDATFKRSCDYVDDLHSCSDAQPLDRNIIRCVHCILSRIDGKPYWA